MSGERHGPRSAVMARVGLGDVAADGAGLPGVVPQGQERGVGRGRHTRRRDQGGELGGARSALGDRLGVAHTGVPSPGPAHALEHPKFEAESGEGRDVIGHVFFQRPEIRRPY